MAGKRLVYEIDFSGSSISDFGALFREGPSLLNHVFESSLEGELDVTILDAGPERISVVYHLRPATVQFQVDGLEADEQAQTIRTDLARPIFGILDARGRVLSVRFHPAVDPLAQHLARTLLAAIQFVGPAAGKDVPAKWEGEEDDPNGTYLAYYQAQSDGAVHKSKVRYLAPKRNTQRRTIVVAPTIESEGEFVVTFDDGSLDGLTAKETQFVTFQGKQLGQASLNLTLRLLRREETTPGELASLRSAASERAATVPAVRLCVAKSSEKSRLAIQRKELGNATLPILLADLAAAETAPQDKDLTGLFLKFKALAIVKPESCIRLGELLTGADAGSLKMRILIEALEAAGHPKAQAALSAAVQGRSGDWPALALLVPALGTPEMPTLPTERTLESLAFGKQEYKIAAAAQLALGNLARSLAGEDPARANKIVGRLLKELAAAKSADSTWQLLLALGNAGAVDTLPTLARYLDDPAPELRSAAAWALRWIDSPQADVLLTSKVLHADKDAAVRLEAVRALRLREWSLANLQAQARILAAEPDIRIRLALLENLWNGRESYPSARRLVERAAASDPASEVRAAAAEILERTAAEPKGR